MTNEEEKVIEWLKNTSLDELVQNIFSYINKLEKENAELTKRLEHLCESDTICSYDEVDIKGNYKKDISTLDKLQKELDKQEKIIDSLAQWVSNLSPMVDKQAVKDIIYKENNYE